MQKTKVSVIVPMYNVEKYLSQCLGSLKCQTMTDIEFICINDGSTDKTLEIAENFSVQDSRFRIVSKANEGYGASINIGLELAKGDYIGIVESDDFVKANMFNALYKTAIESDCEIVKSNFYSYSQKGGLVFEEPLYQMQCNKIFSLEDQPQLLDVNPCIWTALYNAKFLKRNRISFNETPGASYQDISFSLLAYYKAHKMLCIKDAWYCYRTDNENSSINSLGKVFCVMDEFHRFEDYIHNDKRIRKLLEPVKFRHYLGNLQRINSVYKYAFFNEMLKDFFINIEYFDEDYWPVERLVEIKKIYENPDLYFDKLIFNGAK